MIDLVGFIRGEFRIRRKDEKNVLLNFKMSRGGCITGYRGRFEALTYNAHTLSWSSVVHHPEDWEVWDHRALEEADDE